MTQEVFPKIQAATQALEKQIVLTEREIGQMKEVIAGKKQLVRGWRRGILAISPKSSGQKKRTVSAIQGQ